FFGHASAYHRSYMILFSLRWHYPNQVTGLSIQLTLSLLHAQAPPLCILQFLPCPYINFFLCFPHIRIQITEIDIEHFHLLHRGNKYNCYDRSAAARYKKRKYKAEHCALASHNERSDRIT